MQLFQVDSVGETRLYFIRPAIPVVEDPDVRRASLLNVVQRGVSQGDRKFRSERSPLEVFRRQFELRFLAGMIVSLLGGDLDLGKLTHRGNEDLLSRLQHFAFFDCDR